MLFMEWMAWWFWWSCIIKGSLWLLTSEISKLNQTLSSLSLLLPHYFIIYKSFSHSYFLSTDTSFSFSFKVLCCIYITLSCKRILCLLCCYGQKINSNKNLYKKNCFWPKNVIQINISLSLLSCVMDIIYRSVRSKVVGEGIEVVVVLGSYKFYFIRVHDNML